VTYLDSIDLADLQAHLGDAERRETTERLMVAIGYKQGVAIPDLADWYGLETETIEEWFQAFDDYDLDEAVDQLERYSQRSPPPFVPPKRARVEYLNYEVLDDHGWGIDDADLFEKARGADLDPVDFGRIQVNRNETILEAAENRGFVWPFACRGGACSNCAVLLREGEIAMPGDHILSEEAISEYNARLVCVGVPATEDIKLIYNAKHFPPLDDLRLPPGPFKQHEYQRS
jgi:ferredoxin